MKPLKLLQEDRRRTMDRLLKLEESSLLKAQFDTNKFALIPFLDSETERVRNELCTLRTDENDFVIHYAECKRLLNYLESLRESLRDPDKRVKELEVAIRDIDAEIDAIKAISGNEKQQY